MKYEKQIDFMVIVGGDGAVLWGLQYFKDKVPPVLAFGRVTKDV